MEICGGWSKEGGYKESIHTGEGGKLFGLSVTDHLSRCLISHKIRSRHLVVSWVWALFGVCGAVVLVKLGRYEHCQPEHRLVSGEGHVATATGGSENLH